MATFTGSNLNNIADAVAGTISGFSDEFPFPFPGHDQELVFLQDTIGDFFDCLDGSDTVVAGIGDDTVDGGRGNDLLNGDFGDDILRGDLGADTLIGRLGNDVLYADSPGSTIDTAANRLEGGDGNDSLSGALGNDVLLGGNGVDTISGSNGNDSIQGGQGVDNVKGGGGNDTLTVLNGELLDEFDGFTGIDLINLSDFNTLVATVNLAAGTWSVAGLNSSTLSSVENVKGGGGADSLIGSGVGNNLSGLNGNDTLQGGGGVDTLNGGNGNDSLRGGVGADAVNGDAGNDTLSVLDGEFVDDFDGGTGIDTADLSGFDTEAVTVNLTAGTWSVAGLNSSTLANVENAAGGGGNDLLIGSTAANTFKGGGGSDTLNGGDGNDRLYGFNSLNPTGSTNADTINGGAGNDTITASNGGDFIVGGVGLDVINGNGGNDTVNGGNDTDRIDGGSGSDRLVGGLGIDRLTGGLGRDVMTGGGDVDLFDYNAIAETGVIAAMRDVITDFNAGTSSTSVDRIDLSTIGGFVFGTNLTAVQAGANVLIRLNTDADAAPEAVIQLNNVDAAKINAGDFFL